MKSKSGLGPYFMQDLQRPSSSFGFCSECVDTSFVDFGQIKIFFFKASAVTPSVV